MTFVVKISATPETEKKLKDMLENRQRAGYPKVGDKITAIKTGFALIENPHCKLGHVTSGRTYEVFDNIDLAEGFLHVAGDGDVDDPAYWSSAVRLSLDILEEFFGITLFSARG